MAMFDNEFPGGAEYEFGPTNEENKPTYDDHRPISAQEAKQQLIDAAGDVGDNADSLDKAADALLLRVSQFFGECVGGSTFCGLSIDEVRNEDGLLASLTLVPCDLVSGEPVRRVAK